MKTKRVELKVGKEKSEGELLIPIGSREVGVVIAHGAGGNMHDRFVTFFHQQIAAAGYACLKFNFFYSQARRKVPDPQPVLLSCYEKAM